MRRRLVPALLAATVLLPTAGCGDLPFGGGDAFTVYSGRNSNLVGPLLEMFEQDSGIEMDVRYAGTAELTAQILEEGADTRADLFLAQDAGALGALAKADAIGPLDAAVDAVPERFRDAGGRWVGVSGRARVIVYNDRALKAADVPDSVFDLTDAKWRGKVGIAPTNASFQSFVTGMRVLAGEARTEQWLRDIQHKDVREYDNNIAVLDAVDRGEIDLGLINHYYWFEKAKEVGAENMHAQVKFLAGTDPGALVNVAGVAVLKGADHATEARRLVEFLLGDKAQAYFRDALFEYPLVDGVEPAPGLPPLAEVSGPKIDLADLDTLEDTLALLDRTGLT
ncbi:MAG TPA: iron ABC transporter substrate-binding protein [Mycobacteriales bacterium]|nr:iron ABC transporter substrate-binding protein [Mycobacteriales bacterium]